MNLCLLGLRRLKKDWRQVFDELPFWFRKTLLLRFVPTCTSSPFFSRSKNDDVVGR